MTRAWGVIGAAYGDEGKGLLTDHWCEQARVRGERAVAVRFNGGAQAGHTVVRADGRRHVFHHWGAGALAGAATHLGSRFVAHPMLFAQESRTLVDLGGCPIITADPRVRVTTPVDVMLNQAIETARGAARHGSCGMGFGETCARNEDSAFALTLGQIAAWNDADLLGFLSQLVDGHLPKRMGELGLTEDALGPWPRDPRIAQRFVQDCRWLLNHVALADPSTLRGFDAVVFEGAQGLALDEELGDFPYVTRSKTGLPYLVELADEAGLSDVQVTYCTRAYTTRHGAGPLPFETELLKVRDLTNLPNAHQGVLRFAPLLLDDLARRVRADRARSAGRVGLSFGILVSCMDQVGSMVTVANSEAVAREDLSAAVQTALDSAWRLESHGPRSHDVRAVRALRRTHRTHGTHR